MEKIKLFKKNDIILITVLLLLAAAGLFVFKFINSGEGKKVRVTIDGELFGEYELSGAPGTDGEAGFDAVAGSVIKTGDKEGHGAESAADTEKIRIEIPGKIGRCVLVIEDGKAYMEEADCPNQICVHHSAISHKGETIVCLPNRIVIEVQ